ncbi:MAG: serine/threonine protein kinase [Actinomycetia bacterium]|nr:serine/threonine protein kinase [Actinomycetes bacterium]
MAVVDLGIPGLRAAEQIGEGGNAIVYRAYDVDHDRWVAVKVLHKARDEATLRRFDRERKTMGRLSAHDGIVTILTSGVSSTGWPYLVMPLLTGGSLEDELRRRGPVPWPEAVATATTIADAVAAAHAANVIHRDLKPANILLGPSGKPMVADFGISQILDSGAIGTSVLALTPQYTAPDLLDQPPPASMDVYALGATLYEMALGTTPYVQGNDEGIMDFLGRVRREPLPDLRGHAIPETLVGIVEASLAKSAASRPSSMNALANALRTTLEVLEQGAQRPNDLPPTIRVDDDATVRADGGSEVRPASVPTLRANDEPTLRADHEATGRAEPAEATSPPQPAEMEIIEWHPHIDIAVKVDDLAGTSEIIDQAAWWCLDHRGVYVIISVDDERFVQLLVEQNGDAYAETSRADIALLADLGWLAPEVGHDDLAHLTLPLGMPRRHEAIVELLMSTTYRVHGFDHATDIAIQTGLAGSGSPVLGVTFDRDIEHDLEVTTDDELEQLIWHGVLWSRSTRQISVMLDFGAEGVDRWQTITAMPTGDLELRSCCPDDLAGVAVELGWGVDPAEPTVARQRLSARSEGIEERAYHVLLETFRRGLGVELPTRAHIVTSSI